MTRVAMEDAGGEVEGRERKSIKRVTMHQNAAQTSSSSTAQPLSADSNRTLGNRFRISRGAERICLSIFPPDS